VYLKPGETRTKLVTEFNSGFNTGQQCSKAIHIAQSNAVSSYFAKYPPH